MLSSIDTLSLIHSLEYVYHVSLNHHNIITRHFPSHLLTNNPQAIVARSVPTVTPRKPIAKAATSSPSVQMTVLNTWLSTPS